MDNAPGHPTTMCDYHENMKIKFLPANTTSPTQPMDQGLIQTYLRAIFRQAVRATEGQNAKSLKQFWKEFDI
jgi:hypothetical protein